MPALVPGQKVKRLIPSRTGRSILVGMIGVMGGLNPSQHDNSTGWLSYGYVPIQWVNGLWSNLPADEEGYSWEYFEG